MKLETIFKHRLGTGLNGLFFSAPPHLRGIIGSMIGRGQTQSLALRSGGADWAGPGVDAEEGKLLEVADDEEEEKEEPKTAFDITQLKLLEEEKKEVDAMILRENTKRPRDYDILAELEDKKEFLNKQINRINRNRLSERINKPSMLSVAIPKPELKKKIKPIFNQALEDIKFSTLETVVRGVYIDNYIGGNNKAWETRVKDDKELLKNILGFPSADIYSEAFGSKTLTGSALTTTPYDLFVSQTEDATKGFFIECKKYDLVSIEDLWKEYKNKIQMYVYGLQKYALDLSVAERTVFMKEYMTDEKLDLNKVNLNFYRDCPDYPGIIIGVNKTPFLKSKYKSEKSPTLPEAYKVAYSKSKESKYSLPLQLKKGTLSFQSVSYEGSDVYKKGDYGLMFSVACSDGALFCNYFDIFKKHGIEYEEALNIFSASRTYYVSSGTAINSFKLPINEFFTIDLRKLPTFINVNKKTIADEQVGKITEFLKKIIPETGRSAITKELKDFLTANKKLLIEALTRIPLKKAERTVLTTFNKINENLSEAEKDLLKNFYKDKPKGDPSREPKPMTEEALEDLLTRLTVIIPR